MKCALASATVLILMNESARRFVVSRRGGTSRVIALL